ncbi:MarR family winged helix-turn-helix transcriptional regulator [Pseudonocardia cypriaca]|uniref:MarR family transcriptional regulator n=1 Tax=Pseudonocardia cypriaca TaxID=882449 RepID=A0A543GIE9_9PSEU|nr:MarR family transcriptional regulator [Pseudonocardia cypriaca]TQM45852.1 MarR family transcriptional regulator [Pseudonocardia cypriaca]
MQDYGDELLDATTSISRLTRMLRRSKLSERACAEAGIVLDRIGLQILGHVRKAEQPPSVKELAEAMQVEGPHATRQVQRLVARGLLEKNVDPDDRRVARLALTPEGVELIDRYHAVIKGWMRDAVADWPAEDKRQVCRLVTRWVDDIETYFDELDNQPFPRARP